MFVRAVVVIASMLLGPVVASEPVVHVPPETPAPPAAEAQATTGTTPAPADPLQVTGPQPHFPLQSTHFKADADSYDDQDGMQEINDELLEDFLVALRGSSQEYLSSQVAQPEITFNELMLHPEKYRGQVVRLQGILRQVRRYRIPNNSSGITSYWKGQITNAMGHITTFASIEPPPVGQQNKPVEVCGIFMKRFAYLNETPGEMLTICPLVFIRALKPLQEPPLAEQNPFGMNSPAAMVIFLVLAAGLIAYFFFRLKTRVPAANIFTRSKIDRSGGPPGNFPRPGRKFGDK